MPVSIQAESVVHEPPSAWFFQKPGVRPSVPPLPPSMYSACTSLSTLMPARKTPASKVMFRSPDDRMMIELRPVSLTSESPV